MPYRLFKTQVDRNPGAVALVQDDRAMTYFDFDRAIHGSASALREVYAGGVIASCLDNSIYNLQVLYAAALLGAPLCTLDPTLTVYENIASPLRVAGVGEYGPACRR